MIELQYGINFDQGGMKDAKTAGGAQAFVKDVDGKGYVQEMAIPSNRSNAAMRDWAGLVVH